MITGAARTTDLRENETIAATAMGAAWTKVRKHTARRRYKVRKASAMSLQYQ